MKSKKIILGFLVMLTILFISSVKVEASQDLNELRFDVQINEDGSMDIVETWNIYIEETNTLFKTFKKDSSKYSEITNVKVSEIINGQSKEFTNINQEMYHVTKDCYYGLENSNGLFEIAWGVGLDDDYDTRTYQISYKVKDAIAKYNDYAELYWQFVGEDFEIDANKIKGTIYLPQNVEKNEDIKVWGHTKYLNGEIYVTDLNKIEFSVNRYSGGNYVEIRSLFPKTMIYGTSRQYDYDILESVIEEETIWADEANARRENLKKVQNIIAGVGIAITLFFVTRIFKNISKLSKLDKKFKPTTKLQYYRELPYEDATPAEALFMISSGVNKSFSSSFSANILDLCLKKYIELDVIEKKGTFSSGEVKIKLLEKNIEELKLEQKLTFNFLKEVSGNDKQLTTKDITKYLKKHLFKVESLNESLEKILDQQEISNNNYSIEKKEEMNKYGIICALYSALSAFSIPLTVVCATYSTLLMGVSLAFMITLIINAILVGVMSNKVNVFTQKGVDEKEQWKAFKKYMEDFSLLKDKEVPALVLWEKYLVFATAFGISEKVLKQLKVIYPEITDMNSSISTYSYIHIMNSVNIGDCINSSVYSATGSSGSGAGGGFSGGGGGGRWPEEVEEDVNVLIHKNKEDILMSSFHIIR